MTPADVVKYYDNSIAFAAYNLGYSAEAVRLWTVKGRVPPKAQRLIQALTGGKLKADEKKSY